MKAILSCLALTPYTTIGFQPLHLQQVSTRAVLPRERFSSPLYSVQQEEEIKESNSDIDVERLRKEAEIMRLQAEQMDLSLTLQKIEALESKLQNTAWLEKHPDQESDLQAKLQRLNEKLKKGPEDPTEPAKPTASDLPLESQVKESSSSSESTVSKVKTVETPRSSTFEPQPSKKKKKLPEVPLAGFDQSDLDKYIPIAKEINERLPDSSMEERLEAFRTAPELQDLFQAKIQNMLIGPLEEMQQLETLKNEYLASNSSKEREQLKRQIDQLENSVEEDGPFMYSDGLYCEALTPLSEEELARRLEAVGSLPDILIAIYKQRNGMGEDEDLSLAIQMDYYEPQLQLLDQVRALDPITDEVRQEYEDGFNSLPIPVRQRFATNCGLDKDSDAATVLQAALDSSAPMSPLMQVVEASNMQSQEPAEYNDVEFVDRSRYLEEFFPSIGNMEGRHPALEDIEAFTANVLDRKHFMVTSKPERVAGGYYIRGTNLFEDDEDGSITAADKLVAEVSQKMAPSPLSDKLEFFYILDPSPPTDEEMEFGPTEKPIFVITTKDPDFFYNWSKPAKKFGITLSGILSTFMFSVGTCALNPSIYEHFTSSLDAAFETGTLDLQWFSDLYVPIFTSLLAIQLAHEVGHRAISLRDEFDIGVPNVIPSIATGLTGAITPLRSPPPNSKSMFDFAMAGPLAGLLASLALLVVGLETTTSMALGTQLPVLPVDLVRASSLGGGLVQFFLGNAAVLPGQGPGAVLQMHPYAIAGFIGLITNSLALLPLGHTDGGRIAVTMFGRRGAFVVKLFTTLLLCVAGIFGLDETNIFLLYVLYATIWQRELETPSRNEVDELDFPRGLVGIVGALLVGLALIPML